MSDEESLVPRHFLSTPPSVRESANHRHRVQTFTQTLEYPKNSYCSNTERRPLCVCGSADDVVVVNYGLHVSNKRTTLIETIDGILILKSNIFLENVHCRETSILWKEAFLCQFRRCPIWRRWWRTSWRKAK